VLAKGGDVFLLDRISELEAELEECRARTGQ